MLAFAPAAAAQESPPPRAPEHELERLDALLQDLRALGPSIWQAKLARVERKVADQRARTVALRAEIERLVGELARAEARVAEGEAEIEELRALAAHVHPGEIPAVAARRQGAAPLPSEGALAQASKPATMNSGSPAPATPSESMPAGAPPNPPAGKSGETPPAPAPTPSYAEHLHPIFEASCVACHDAGDPRGGLDLSTYEAALRGGSSGATLVPGNPDGSRLWRLAAHLEEPFMPKGRPQLAAAELDLLKRWIEGGALRDAAAVAKKTADEAAAAEAKRKEAAPEAKEAGEGNAAPSEPPLALDLPYHAVREAELPAPLIALAHSPSAPLLAAAGIEQVLLIAPQGRRVLGVLPFEGRVTRLQFSRDGARLLVAGGDPRHGGRAMLVDVQTGAVAADVRQGKDQLFAAALSPGQSTLAVGGPTRRVQALRTASQELLYEIRAHGDWILCCAFSPDGNLLATADRAGAALTWQADTGRDVASLRGHEGPVNALAFSADASVLVTLGEDGHACGWNPERGNRLWRTRVGDPPGTALAMLGDGDLLAASGNGALLRLDARDGKAKGNAWPSFGTWIASLAVTSDGARAYVGTAQGELIELDLAKNEILSRATVVPIAGASAP